MARLTEDQRAGISKIARLEILAPIVMEVRSYLAEKYDVTKDGDHPRYEGLCDEACELVIDRLNSYIEDHCNADKFNIKTKLIHGEIAHDSSTYSCNWYLQHTWLRVEICGISIYVDPTSSQFRDVLPTVPNFYIADVPPAWFYPDAKNPAFKTPFMQLNRFRIIPVKDAQHKRHRIGIVDWLQYWVWGYISDRMKDKESRG